MPLTVEEQAVKEAWLDFRRTADGRKIPRLLHALVKAVTKSDAEVVAEGPKAKK